MKARIKHEGTIGTVVGIREREGLKQYKIVYYHGSQAFREWFSISEVEVVPDQPHDNAC